MTISSVTTGTVYRRLRASGYGVWHTDDDRGKIPSPPGPSCRAVISQRGNHVPVPPTNRFERHVPPEIAALKRLKEEQPELAVAIDMQVEIVTLQRRVQMRLTTPWVAHEPQWFVDRMAGGHPIMVFDEIAFDWAEVRGLFRQLVDVLRRYEIIEDADYAALQALVRGGHPNPDDIRGWFEGRIRRDRSSPWVPPYGETFAQALELSVKPFVERAGETLRSRLDLADWTRPYCPVCGGEAEMGSLGQDGSRRLHCGTCAASWAFDADVCPACETRDPRRQLSYASADGRYRLAACSACKRYLKLVDTRRANRPLMLSVDSIATLPLDAAANQQGYSNEG
jgi:hypothetical protein